MDKAKSYHISKHVVMEAYKRVKANKGAAGVDDSNLIRWARKKYDKIRISWRKGTKWLNGIKNREPTLFRHWQWMRRNDLDRRAV